MICGPCREAGHWLRLERPATAATFHGYCHGGNWCDCQHKLTPAVISKPANISTVLMEEPTGPAYICYLSGGCE